MKRRAAPPTFKVVIPCHNAYPWIGKCLRSVDEQTYRNFDVCVVDDASTDEHHHRLLDSFEGKDRWTIIRNIVWGGPLISRLTGIDRLACENDDVIILLDGDDWLLGPEAFSRIATEYEQFDPLITHNRRIVLANRSVGTTKPWGWWARRRKIFRKKPNNWGSLFTFRYALWKHVDDQDLRDKNGDYYIRSTDRAMILPMLEMAGHKIRFIPEAIHIHNDKNPINCDKVISKSYSEAVLEEILRKPRYATLNALS